MHNTIMKDPSPCEAVRRALATNLLVLDSKHVSDSTAFIAASATAAFTATHVAPAANDDADAAAVSLSG